MHHMNKHPRTLTEIATTIAAVTSSGVLYSSVGDIVGLSVGDIEGVVGDIEGTGVGDVVGLTTGAFVLGVGATVSIVGASVGLDAAVGGAINFPLGRYMHSMSSAGGARLAASEPPVPK